MWTNHVKQQLASGQTVFGPFQRLAGPIGVSLAAAAGFDFVVIDLEHSAIDPAQTQAMIYAAMAGGITPVIRVPDASSPAIHNCLDMGAQGILVPQVNTAAEALLVNNATRFAPVGMRGMGGLSQGDNWGELPTVDSQAILNREVLTIVQIESVEGLENLDSIAAQPGIDILFVGPVDLSQALGVPGQTDHPRLIEATEKVIGAASRYGKTAGIYAGSSQAAAFWRDRGVRFIGSGLDTALLKQAYSSLRSQLR